MKNRSRLSRRMEQKSKRNIVLFLLATILLMYVLVKYGLPILVNASLLVSGIKNTPDSPSQNSSLSFVSPPVLDPLPTATNSASVTVSGTSLGEKVKLYVNGDISGVKKTNANNSFKFENVVLKKGDNVILTKTETPDNKSSDFSNQISILYKDSKPSLSLDSPSDGQSFSKDQNPVEFKGKTDPGVKITINGFWAIVEANGKFSYNLKLQSGDNKIQIEATDDAGNKTEIERKSTYNP